MSLGGVITATAAIACFAYILVRSNVVRVIKSVPVVASLGVTTMLDPTLDDDLKEKAVRKAGVELVISSWQITWRIGLALAATCVPILFASTVGLVNWRNSYSVLIRVDFLIVASISAILLSWIFRRLTAQRETQQTGKISDSSAYSSSDRLLHAIAFSGPRIQNFLARLDDQLYASKIRETPSLPPIFICSLARGGTTALLGAMHGLPQIATHRYCDMPFLSAPMAWNRLAGNRSKQAARERSHGDGIKIGLQSPEAFDEVFWMQYWPEKYTSKNVILWSQEDYKKAPFDFFHNHFRKIISLRRPEELKTEEHRLKPARYLSKNNANIARLALLPKMFPGCQILVPIREPSSHAASLYRQHKNFSKLHSVDAFSERYMRDIGHFDFGTIHKPIAFENSASDGEPYDHPDYWLAYWITCFEHILLHAKDITLIPQQDLREKPQETMEAILSTLKVSNPSPNHWRAHFLSKPDEPMDELFDNDLLERARKIYNKLYTLRLQP